MSGLSPAVANLFASHGEQQQPQPQQMHMQQPFPPTMAPPPHMMAPMHAQAYPGPPPPPQPQAYFPPHDPFAHGPPQPQPFAQQMHFQPPPPPPPPPHAFQGQPFPPQMMHPHAQMMMQQQQQQQQPHQMMYVSGPPAPPPSRQVSEQLAPSQVSGPGSLLSLAAETESVASAVGVAIVSDRECTLSLSPDDKHLGGEDHASTPCAELSSIPRSLDESVGCLIAHQAGVTVFALKAGLARLLYSPTTKSVDAHSSASDAQQSEVLKGHASSILDVSFLPQETTEELASRGVKLEAGQRASFVATLSSSLIQLYQITFTEGQAKVACKLAFSVPGQQLQRLRVGRTADGRSSIVVLSGAGSAYELDPWRLLSLAGAAAPASALELLPFGSVVDVTWTTGRTPLYTNGSSWTHAGVTHAAAAVERVIAVPHSTCVLVVSANSDASSKTLSVHRVADGELVSSVTLVHADVLFSAVEVAPSGEFVAVAYRRSESTGEAHDAGFFVLQLSSEPRGVPADARVFVFASVFFQPSPIVSLSIADADAADGSFNVFAVEQKPIVRLHIARHAVTRVIHADEVRRPAGPASSASALLAASTSSGIAHGQGEVTGEHDESRDAVPALRSSLPPLMAAQDSAHSDSPPSPAIVAFSGAAAAVSNPPSNASSVSNSRMQSPGVARVDRPDFNQIDHSLLDSSVDYSSGRSSPSHPLKPVLRPRGNSTGETGRGVQFNLPGGPASSQPTPNSTPGPGTPSGIRGLSSLENSDSPLPSPLPSPRSSLAGSRGLSDPSSPFQPQTGSVATTTDVSAAQSPFVSSHSSPLISPSPTPAPPVLDESGITSIPSTPSHHAQPAPGSSSSTGTPAPTPLAAGAAGGVRLSQMSTADVSLHFLSAVSHDPSRAGAGGAGQSSITTPMNTPMVTPASSVPNTPRGSVAQPPRKSSLVSGSFALGMAGGGVNVAPTPSTGSSVLRVRTQSGSTSPSPISSPSFASSAMPSSGQKYHRVRSQSMDRADSFSGGRMLADSQMVEPVPEEGATQVGSPAEPHPPRPTSASSGLVPKPIASAHDSSKSGKATQEQNLVRVLDQLFGRHFGRLSGIIASERLAMQQEERARMEQITAALVQNVSSAVGERITGVIDSVCEDQLVPAVTEAIAAQLSASGVSSGAGAGVGGSSVDSASIVAGLRAPLQESFRSAFVSTLLPSFESSIKQMLVQIHSSVQGITAAASKDSADEAAQADQRRRALEEEKKARLFDRAESARREKALSSQISEMHEIISALAQSQLKLTQTVAEMKGMIAAGAAANVVAARAPASAASAASPPTPPTPRSVDLTAEIGSLLQSEQFDRAFTMALSSGKLSAVQFAIRQLDPRTLLSTTVAQHRLSSPVVLSLIQQLAASLQSAAAASIASPTDSDLRVAINWLRECVMVIKLDEPTIAAHVKPILKQASAQAEQLHLPAQHAMFDAIRMLCQLLQLKSAN